MNVTELPIFKLMGRRMDWLTERQKVLAQNIANSDTPNYRPHDLKPMAFDDLVRFSRDGVARRLSPERTDASHFGHSGAQGDRIREAVQDKTYETNLSGNAVVIEEQLMKVGETDMQYQIATNLYRKYLGLFRTALGRGGMSG
ncbi:MAG: flagellar basal body rod protein FlgB [Rhodospirillaceae bacterium]|jgi:flagellar basal-body rod protein FlgB|nr:flagellar basal body rod protein FlgB [Rhodospirillaceae bacterium]MBT6116933.1 flagellar basal body rod protein FlgB [Rhodospirillaceae bacterium]